MQPIAHKHVGICSLLNEVWHLGKYILNIFPKLDETINNTLISVHVSMALEPGRD